MCGIIFWFYFQSSGRVREQLKVRRFNNFRGSTLSRGSSLQVLTAGAFRWRVFWNFIIVGCIVDCWKGSLKIDSKQLLKGECEFRGQRNVVLFKNKKTRYQPKIRQGDRTHRAMPKAWWRISHSIILFISARAYVCRCPALGASFECLLHWVTEPMPIVWSGRLHRVLAAVGHRAHTQTNRRATDNARQRTFQTTVVDKCI